MTTLLCCVACGDRPVVKEGAGESVCSCGRSVARLEHDCVEVHGPAEVGWVDGSQPIRTTSIDWRSRPTGAPHVRRRPSEPLI